MDNHLYLIWQVKGEYEPSEIQKCFLENISKQIKKRFAVVSCRSFEIIYFNAKGQVLSFLETQSFINRIIYSNSIWSTTTANIFGKVKKTNTNQCRPVQHREAVYLLSLLRKLENDIKDKTQQKLSNEI